VALSLCGKKEKNKTWCLSALVAKKTIVPSWQTKTYNGKSKS